MPQTIREVMSNRPVTVDPGATLRQAAQLMRDHAVGDVIVVEDGRLAGLVTDRDIVVRAVAESHDPAQVTVGDISTTELDCLAPDDSVEDAIRLMRKRAVRRVPVVEDGRPIGIVSIGDLAIERDADSALADISAAPANN